MSKLHVWSKSALQKSVKNFDTAVRYQTSYEIPTVQKYPLKNYSLLNFSDTLGVFTISHFSLHHLWLAQTYFGLLSTTATLSKQAKFLIDIPIIEVSANPVDKSVWYFVTSSMNRYIDEAAKNILTKFHIWQFAWQDFQRDSFFDFASC